MIWIQTNIYAYSFVYFDKNISAFGLFTPTGVDSGVFNFCLWQGTINNQQSTRKYRSGAHSCLASVRCIQTYETTHIDFDLVNILLLFFFPIFFVLIFYFDCRRCDCRNISQAKFKLFHTVLSAIYKSSVHF